MNIGWRRYKFLKLQPSNAVWTQIEPMNFDCYKKLVKSWTNMKILPDELEERAQNLQWVWLNLDIGCKVTSLWIGLETTLASLGNEGLV